MRTGYSNMLGEYVEAADIEYRDVTDFGIVCPACHEPLYKVVRGEQHFLSHRIRELVKTQECEMRVEGIAQSVKALTNSESRQQTLAFFFSALPTMIADLLPNKHGAWSYDDVNLHFSRDANARRVRDFYHTFCMGRADSTFEWGLPRALRLFETLKEEGGEKYNWEEGLNRTLQQRIALDMLRTMCTPPGRKGFHHLFTGAWAYEWSVLTRPVELTAPTDALGEATGAAKLGILSKPAQGGNLFKAFLKSREQQIPGAPSGHTAGNVLMTSFQTSMVMLLLRLDYSGYLKAWIDGFYDDHIRKIGATHLLVRSESLTARRYRASA